jgi:hypothetical protein
MFREEIGHDIALSIIDKSTKGVYNGNHEIFKKMTDYVKNTLNFVADPIIKFVYGLKLPTLIDIDNNGKSINVIVSVFLFSKIPSKQEKMITITKWSCVTLSDQNIIYYDNLKFSEFYVIQKPVINNTMMIIDKEEYYKAINPILTLDKGIFIKNISINTCGLLILNYMVFIGEILILKSRFIDKPYKIIIEEYNKILESYPLFNNNTENIREWIKNYTDDYNKDLNNMNTENYNILNVTDRLFRSFILTRNDSMINFVNNGILQSNKLYNTNVNEFFIDFENFDSPDIRLYIDFTYEITKIDSINIINNIIINNDKLSKKYYYLTLTAQSAINEIKKYSNIETTDCLILSCNKIKEFINLINHKFNSILIESNNNIEYIKIESKFMIYLLSLNKTESFNILSMIYPSESEIYKEMDYNIFSNTIKYNILGMINKGYIYITPMSFIIKILPNIQRLISRINYFKSLKKVEFHNHTNNSNYNILFDNGLMKLYFGNNNYNEHNIKIFIEYVLNNFNTKGLEHVNKIKERLSIININTNNNNKQNSNKFSIDYHEYIKDIEDLCKTKEVMPPCINRIIDDKIHLKNFDRMIFAYYLLNIGVKKEEIEQIKLDEDKKYISEINEQYDSIMNNPSRYYQTGCSTIINEKFTSCFKCPYKNNTKEEESSVIIHRCQKEHNIKHYSPLSFTYFKLSQMEKLNKI